MRILRGVVGSSLLALVAGTAAAQVTTAGTNRSEVQDNGRDNKAQVENGAPGNERNSSLVFFGGNNNRATVSQTGQDNPVTTRQQGESNNSIIRQLGFRNSVTVGQAGNGNASSVEQFIDPRIAIYGDRAVSVQQNGNANQSSVTQVHWLNSATVIQNSNGAASTIFQFSAGNVAKVTINGGSPDASNRSHIEQTRIDPVVTNSSATVELTGGLNLSYLYQIGANNVAQHNVSGGGNIVVGKSYGNSLQSFVFQEGFRNIATLSQSFGDRNSSRIEQRNTLSGAEGGDRQVHVVQGGSDNSSTVLQRFSANTVVVNQSGSATASSVNQNGHGNMARANLSDSSLDAPNKSTITQEHSAFSRDFETRHLANVRVGGLGNESSISQNGARHIAFVDMAGGGAGSDEGGRRRGNQVTIQQDITLSFGQQQINSAGHLARVQVGHLQGGGVGTVTNVRQQGQHSSIGNDAVVRQEGLFDVVSVRQSTRSKDVDGGAIANVSARGILNRVDLAQFGRVFAIITQGIGRESSLTATQYDSAGSRFPEAFFRDGRGNNSIKAAQNGDRNTAAIVQEGTDNRAAMWQKVGSSDNTITINQGANRFGIEDEPFCSGPTARCQFSSDAVVSVTQSGRFNSASTIQYSGSAAKAVIEQNGTGSSLLPNVARITQVSTSGEASILQTADVGPSGAGDPASGASGDPNFFAGGSRSAEARIRQGAGALSARIEQRGRGQYAFIDQTGANTAAILQDVGATNATAVIAQSGSGNVFNVVQTQAGQYINVSQTGTNNSNTSVITRP